ncbi:hypothetical protein ACIRPU_43685 [Streptomyces sp. NPDC102259]|uniref:hypothetical protein n=1 Tax=Streptomyces sp. NPDC102259 TaxID=3366148 RepID=UPI0038249A2B
MDSYEGSAALEWWANRSTCLGRFRVRVVVRSGDAWTCEASPESPLGAEDRESFDFLMELDPCFPLRFDDTSALLVDVVEAGAERLILTAAETVSVQTPGTRRVPRQ